MDARFTGAVRPSQAKSRTYEENLALINARGQSAKSSTPQLCLEFWPKAVCGIPNSSIRSALFGVSQLRKIYEKRTLIVSTSEYQVRFKGETWNQTDLDTVGAMLDLAMPHPLGTRVEFAVNALLKKLRRPTSGEQHDQFKEQVARIIGGVIEITSLREEAHCYALSPLLAEAEKNHALQEIIERLLLVPEFRESCEHILAPLREA